MLPIVGPMDLLQTSSPGSSQLSGYPGFGNQGQSAARAASSQDLGILACSNHGDFMGGVHEIKLRQSVSSGTPPGRFWESAMFRWQKTGFSAVGSIHNSNRQSRDWLQLAAGAASQ